MKSEITLFNASMTRLSISDICHGSGKPTDKYTSVVQLFDTVEDSKDSKELIANIKKLCFVGFNNPVIDRETVEYVRLRASDIYDNICYMKIMK
jgi:hypothetical protein